jgi:hypothetical protein
MPAARYGGPPMTLANMRPMQPYARIEPPKACPDCRGTGKGPKLVPILRKTRATGGSRGRGLSTQLVAVARFAAMALNTAERFVPTDVTATMITTAISAAMRPYSIAVTPDSSRAKRNSRALMVLTLDLHC